MLEYPIYFNSLENKLLGGHILNELINKNYEINKLKLKEIINSLSDLSKELNDKEINIILDKINKSLDKPFMFVIIGEVKAGKSSFINALLNTPNLCKVDIDVCTDKISQIIYSEETYEKELDSHLIEKGINNDILKEIAIVDTPGTDSIVKQHELITKSFAPNSDLIIFVFPAFNPHHRSSWEMLDYMKSDWKKNIIFVCQQADRISEAELRVNISKIEQYAREHGVDEVKIFVTSAKNALENKDEGIDKLRVYINEHVTGGRHIKDKLLDKLNSSTIIRDKLNDIIEARNETLNKDIDLRANVQSRFNIGQERSLNEIEFIIDRLLKVYYYKVKIYTDKLDKILSSSNLFKQLIPIIKKEKISKEVLDEFGAKLREEIGKELEVEAYKNASHFIDGIKDIFNNIINDIDKEIQNINREKVYDGFYKKREEIFNVTKQKLEEMSKEDTFINLLSSNSPNVSSIAIKGGTLTVAGALLALLTQNSYLDITGGIMAAVGILASTITIFIKKSRTLKEFRAKLEEAGKDFENSIRIQLENNLKIIFEEINRAFGDFDSHIEKEKLKIKPLLFQISKIDEAIEKYKNTMNRE